MPVEDIETVRMVRREMARRILDSGEVTVSAMKGIIHLTGRVRPVKGREAEFAEEVNTLYRILKQRPGIRDVVLEWNTGQYKVELNRRKSIED